MVWYSDLGKPHAGKGDQPPDEVYCVSNGKEFRIYFKLGTARQFKSARNNRNPKNPYTISVYKLAFMGEVE